MMTKIKLIYKINDTKQNWEIGDTAFYIEKSVDSKICVCQCGDEHDLDKETYVVKTALIDDVLFSGSRGGSIGSQDGVGWLYKLNIGIYARDQYLFKTREAAEANTDPNNYLFD